ncbi:MAG TPA: cytochrome c nitrite reductase small subunit [Candidatus Kapabacteria bacterium]|nr:cytochrome c nitrite reductase small subunit [Candidatus Kapabacteria bacterium]HPO62433.1 cytochrome c nitrite reductase small subunit [Candidatus Kapabacteria bacterium]
MQNLFIIFAGLAVGLGLTIVQISNAPSYLSDEPTACINCHIMTPQYATWQHSSHREWTNCNDCHVPHNNIVRKYFFKASDGLRHASMFTLRLEPQVIQIKEAGKTVVQENCIRCHVNQLNPVSAINVTGHNYTNGEGNLCWDCHREVPHGRVNSLASTPNAIVPGLSPALPNWLEKTIKQKKQ